MSKSLLKNIPMNTADYKIAKYMLEHGLGEELVKKPFLTLGEGSDGNICINDMIEYPSINLLDGHSNLYSTGYSLSARGLFSEEGTIRIDELSFYNTEYEPGVEMLKKHHLFYLASVFGGGIPFQNIKESDKIYLQRKLLSNETSLELIIKMVNTYSSMKVNDNFDAIVSAGNINNMNELTRMFRCTDVPVFLASYYDSKNPNGTGNIPNRFGVEIDERLAYALSKYDNVKGISYDETTDYDTGAKIKMITRKQKRISK